MLSVAKESSAVQMPGSVTFKEVLHTAVFPPRPAKVDAVSQPVIACIINSFSALIYLIHFLGEPDSETHHIGVHGAGGVFCNAQIS